MAFIGNQPTAVPLTSSQLTDGLITSAKIADGAIVNVDVNSTAALAYSKLNLATSIVNGDIANATIALAKLSATGTPSASTFLRGDNSWASAGAAAGQVIQVVTATDSTSRTTTSTSFVTGSNTLSVSITPSASANKVFVICTCEAGVGVSGATFLTIFRDATNLGNTNGMVAMGGLASPSSYDGTQCSISILDSPSTTSAITYQLYFKTNATTGSLNANTVKGSITAFEIKG